MMSIELLMTLGSILCKLLANIKKVVKNVIQGSGKGDSEKGQD